MKKLTDKQKATIKRIHQIVSDKSLDVTKVKPSEFVPELNEDKIRVPWKLLIEGDITPKKRESPIDFTDLFNQINGLDLNTSNAPEETNQASSNELPIETNTNTRSKKSSSTKNPPLYFSNPVYVVESIDSSGFPSTVCIAQGFKTAWSKKYNAIHDNGNVTEDKAFSALEKDGFVYIQSLNCNTLFCKISKKELLP